MHIAMRFPFKWTDEIVSKLSSCQAGRALILDQLGVTIFPQTNTDDDDEFHTELYADGSALVYQGKEGVLVLSDGQVAAYRDSRPSSPSASA